MTLVGLDLNAGRARAVEGRLGDYPAWISLDEATPQRGREWVQWTPPTLQEPADLSMALSLEGRSVEVGAAAQRLRRRMPHLVCHDFLQYLGEPRRWKADRHDLDSFQALEHVWRRLAARLGGRETAVCVPGYLNRWQADHVRRLGDKAGFKVRGSVAAPLAAALASYAERHWTSLAVIVELDDHALSIAVAEAVQDQAHVRETRTLPALGERVWRERLLTALADCCVLQTRRDPRDNADAEQGLYEQIDLILDACAQQRLAQIGFGGERWFQNLVVSPEESIAFCKPLVQRTAHEVRSALGSLGGMPQALILTAEAGRLPGLAAALSSLLEAPAGEPPSQHRPPSDEDFSIYLPREPAEERGNLVILTPEACAQAAHALLGRFQNGTLPQGHLESLAPLPLPWPAEAGPARLTWQGRTFYLDGATFLIGSQAGCRFVLDPSRFPGVAGRHCEIYYDHRTFVLFNRSRDGTWVNDVPVHSSSVLRPGDLIRLTPAGPVLRFLGQPRKAAG